MNLQICRYVIAAIWICQGLVPQLLGSHVDGLMMNVALELSHSRVVMLAWVVGALEVLLGILVLLFYRYRWPYAVTLVAMVGLLGLTLTVAQQFTTSAFHVTTVNLAVSALAVIALSELRAGWASDNFIFRRR